MVRERVFTEVSVAGSPAVSFCVDPPAGDPVAPWLLEHDWIDEPVQRMFLGLVKPGMRVLDLGSHLGTFSLPAAALGAEVLAVDGSSDHVELLRAAALQNGFDKLQAVQAAIAAPGHPPTIPFVALHIHGHVRVGHVQTRVEKHVETVEVTAITVDELLELHGWATVDVVKMDIEGTEPSALAGMENLFGSGQRPAIVLECNGSALPFFRSSIPELREMLAELDYELLLIDHLRPGFLVEADPQTLQPECVSDLLAVVARPGDLTEHWRVEPPFGREQLLSRLLDGGASEHGPYRIYAAQLLADGPYWLRAAPEVDGALRSLEHDLDEDVRAVVAADHEPSWAVENTLAPEPPSRGRPPGVHIWVEGVSLRRPPSTLEPVHAGSGPSPEELTLADAWLHVRSGQLVGVLPEEPALGSQLLRALAGFDEPKVGRVELAGRTVMLSPLAAGLELELTAAENVMVLGSFLGLSAAELDRGIERVAEIAGLGSESGASLEALGTVAAAKLVLATALELGAPDVLLLDPIPPVLDGGFTGWIRDRVAELRQSGSAVVQLIGDRSDFLGPPDRVLWIGAGRVQASGNPESVLEAYRRYRLGLAPRPLDQRSALAMRVPR